MKKLIFLFALLWSFCANAQIITTVAGNGNVGFSGDNGLATVAAIGEPDGCAFDTDGNFYFTTVGNDRVRKVASDGIITTIAGINANGYNGDGIAATAAELNLPGAVAVDRLHNIYIADANNSRVRKVDAITGIITTIAGNGSFGFGGDGGSATASILYSPVDICFDQKGNLYIADYENFRVRKIDTLGIITTVVGNGTEGNSGDGGPATAAQIHQVDGICTDRAGNLYITDNTSVTIRMVNTAGIITTIAGNGVIGPSGDGGPATAASLSMVRLVCDNSGNLYISGYGDNDVRKIDNQGIIHTVAGTGVHGFSGDGGLADTAELSTTYGIALDTCGNLYIADKDNVRIRKVWFNPNCWPESVNGVNTSNEIKIYPNPATTELTITASSPDSYQGNSVQLINMLGQVVLQQKLSTQKTILNISSLPNGIYFIKVNSTYVQKLVKD